MQLLISIFCVLSTFVNLVLAPLLILTPMLCNFLQLQLSDPQSKDFNEYQSHTFLDIYLWVYQEIEIELTMYAKYFITLSHYTIFASFL